MVWELEKFAYVYKETLAKANDTGVISACVCLTCMTRRMPSTSRVTQPIPALVPIYGFTSRSELSSQHSSPPHLGATAHYDLRAPGARRAPSPESTLRSPCPTYCQVTRLAFLHTTCTPSGRSAQRIVDTVTDNIEIRGQTCTEYSHSFTSARAGNRTSMYAVLLLYHGMICAASVCWHRRYTLYDCGTQPFFVSERCAYSTSVLVLVPVSGW